MRHNRHPRVAFRKTGALMPSRRIESRKDKRRRTDRRTTKAALKRGGF